MCRLLAVIVFSFLAMLGADAAQAEQRNIQPAEKLVLPTPRQPNAAVQKPKPSEYLTDAAIVAAIIATSIAAYRAGGPGPCGCPSDLDRAGRRCGKRSAHDRAGGWTVYCSAADVTNEMIDTYRRQKGN